MGKGSKLRALLNVCMFGYVFSPLFLMVESAQRFPFDITSIDRDTLLERTNPNLACLVLSHDLMAEHAPMAFCVNWL